jgi:hypothetical protein
MRLALQLLKVCNEKRFFDLWQGCNLFNLNHLSAKPILQNGNHSAIAHNPSCARKAFAKRNYSGIGVQFYWLSPNGPQAAAQNMVVRVLLNFFSGY